MPGRGDSAIRSKIALWRLTGNRRRHLLHLIDVDHRLAAAKVFGTLQTSIGRHHVKMRLDDLRVARAATSVTLVKLLKLKRLPKLINGRGSRIGKIRENLRTVRIRHSSQRL